MDSNVPPTSIPIHPLPINLESEARPSDTALVIVSKPSTPFKPNETLPLQRSADDLFNNTLMTIKETEAGSVSGMTSFYPGLPSAVTRYNESQMHANLSVMDATTIGTTHGPTPTTSFLTETNTGDAFLNDFFAYTLPGFGSQTNLMDPSLFTSVHLVSPPLSEAVPQPHPSSTQPLPEQVTSSSFVAMPPVVTPTPSLLANTTTTTTTTTVDAAKIEMNVNKKKRHKRPRNSFNEIQKRVLDDFFDHHSHTPTRSEKLQLAKQLNSTERTVTVWFQNRRQKLVKISRLGGDAQANDPSQAVKTVSVKSPKSAAATTVVGVSKKRKVSPSQYLSPPMQPTESPLMANYYTPSPPPPPSYVSSMMLPNAPAQASLAPPPSSSSATNPGVSYAMYSNGGMMDASHPYMLSPVTPTFNPYAIYHPQMRNFQMHPYQSHAPSPTPPFTSHLLQPSMQPSQLPQQQAIPPEMLMEYNQQSLVFQSNANAAVKSITANAIPASEFNTY